MMVLLKPLIFLTFMLFLQFCSIAPSEGAPSKDIIKNYSENPPKESDGGCPKGGDKPYPPGKPEESKPEPPKEDCDKPTKESKPEPPKEDCDKPTKEPIPEPPTEDCDKPTKVPEPPKETCCPENTGDKSCQNPPDTCKYDIEIIYIDCGEEEPPKTNEPCPYPKPEDPPKDCPGGGEVEPLPWYPGSPEEPPQSPKDCPEGSGEEAYPDKPSKPQDGCLNEETGVCSEYYCYKYCSSGTGEPEVYEEYSSCDGKPDCCDDIKYDYWKYDGYGLDGYKDKKCKEKYYLF